MRWGVLAGSLLLVGIVLTIGFWAYQRPEAEAAEALTGVETAATALEEDLLDIRSLNEALLEQGQIGSSTASLLAVEGSARDLFAASGKLPASEADTRSVASRAASEALDASRLLGDATTFRSAVIPILAVPDFETQPGLISLDEAARAFGEWQAQFDSVRAALPDNALASVASELELVSGNLESVQTRYLDALRRDDQWGAATAVNDLEAQLSQAEETMLLTLFEIHETVQVRVEKSLQDIESLLG